MFAGLTEHAFLATLGVADPPLIDYLSGLLSRFVHTDSIYRMRDNSGRRIGELTVMVAEAGKLPPTGRTCREYHRHIGDFTLFWTGLFPESVDRLQSGSCRDHAVNFTTLGKRSYLIASSFPDDKNRDEASVLRRLSEEFELCAFGLREVRREWEDLACQPPPPGLGLIE
jgi:hypothetical protein